ncbi:YdcF family protein [Mucilaginibacter sp. CSA2-8R]|uniref:YdcF family protein n=1 Tax=Mucilaginibacter sp. CSA2-8R TaxID=3141542 RepID=UPI00315DB5A8
MKIRFLILFSLLGFNGFSQQMGAQANYKLVSGGDWVKAKNYYLLTLFEQNEAVKKLLKSDPEFVKLAQAKYKAVQASLTECKEALCLPEKQKLTGDEIQMASNRLRALYKPDNALGNLVKTHLIPSGMYIKYSNEEPVDLLVKAWEQDANYVNYTIGVYAEGNKPNYPQVDSISFDVKRKGYLNLMYDCATDIAESNKSEGLFFAPSLNAALLYLEINERRNASFYEPMASTANKLAADKVSKVKWASYPYSHILVPGAGPDNLTTPLSGEGMLRCRAAARQYFAGKAPFVVVSGGSVHPYKTKYNEAAEMKKYMVGTLHLPDYAVIIEPHARHTTTNIRNDVRLIFRYGMPMAKPGLIVTDKSQNDGIANMEKRCLKELGYVPYKLGNRLTETALEFYPVITSLQIDADEPMDP